MLTPTSRWLATIAEELPPLTGPDGTAERLLLLLYYGIDWDLSWLTAHRHTMWDDQLPDRVYVATYQADQLRAWWGLVADDIGSAPRNRAERIELSQLLAEPSSPVLLSLRTQTTALLLRTRIVAEAVRATRPTKAPSS